MTLFARRKIGWLLSALAAFCLTWTVGSAVGSSSVSIFPLSQLQPGMRGVAHTVVQGTTVESFDVEVLGLLPDAGSHLILFRAEGDLIDRTGGIASGMSGSPLYIDGKLVGAIGYTFPMSDHRLGLATPAEDMLDVMERAKRLGSPRTLPPSPIRIQATDDQAAAALRSATGSDGEAWVAQPVATPLAVSGLGPRAMQRLESVFSRWDLLPLQGVGAGAWADAEAPFEPGSAFAVELVRGDIGVAAVGTVTAVDESGYFVALGHPFLHLGDVDFFAAGAHVIHTVPSAVTPFKLASPTKSIGSVTQDRASGVAGRLGAEPKTTSVSVEVLDLHRGESTRLEADVVGESPLTPTLAIIAALEGLDRALDRLGPGTSRISYTVEGHSLPRPLERSNMHFSSVDVAAASLGELYWTLETLAENQFHEPSLSRVAVRAEIDAAQKTAHIEAASPSTDRAHPGSVVDVSVRLRPFRGDPFEVTVPIEIPDDALHGPVTVSVRSGGQSFWFDIPFSLEDVFLGESGSIEDDFGLDSGPSWSESLESLLQDLEEAPRNHDLIVEFYPDFDRDFSYDERDEAEQTAMEFEFEFEFDAEAVTDDDHVEAFGGSNAFSREFAPVRAIKEMDHVIFGEAYFTLYIDDPEAGRRRSPSFPRRSNRATSPLSSDSPQ